MTRIELPFPPSTNNLFENAGKRRIRSAKYISWIALASTKIKDAHRLNLSNYSISICLKNPDKRRRDLGNFEKAISDLLVMHSVVKDDSYCQRITMQWDAGLGAECVVLVQPFEEGLAA